MNAKFSSAATTATPADEQVVPAVQFQPAASPEHTIRRGTIKFEDFKVDLAVQRPENRGLINRIKREFDQDALGSITISVRTNQVDGTDEFIILDGQQRTTAAHEIGYDAPFHAVFHYGLSMQDEARLFRLLQVRVGVPIKEQFRVALTENRPDATGVMRVLNELGIKLDPNGGFVAVGVGLRIARQTDGLDNLRWALRFIQDTWADDPSPYDGRLVEALTQLKQRHGAALKTPRLKEQIHKAGKTIDKLIGDSKVRRGVHKNTAVKSLGDELIKVYDTGLQKKGPNWLPFWNDED